MISSRRETHRWWPWAIIVPLVLALAATAVALLVRHSAGPVADHPGSQQSAGTEPEGGIDWNNPFPDSVAVSTAQAISDVSFTPLVPANVGTPTRVLVSNPANTPRADREVAFVYNSPTDGQFVVFENVIPSLTQADLEARVQLNNPSPAPGETVSTSAVFSVVTIRGGTRAVLEVVSPPSSDGMGPNSIEWLNSGVNITIMGPDGTFTPQVATAIANAV